VLRNVAAVRFVPREDHELNYTTKLALDKDP
jgi:hypothetical protein